MADVLPPIPYDRPQTSFEWIDWYTKVINLINSWTQHNLLPGLKGGTSGEYYHLTSADYSSIISLISAGSIGQTPYYIATGEIFTVEANRQVLFNETIIVDGTLTVDGMLIYVS